MIEIVLLLIGLVVGFLMGWFFGKSAVYSRADIASQLSTIQNLNTQIAEMKAKFEEIEKARDKISEEKEKRFNEFIEGTKKIFQEIKDGIFKSDEEKEKRIKELIEKNQQFFKEQKEYTEKFLEQQGKSREEIEKQRDAQLKDMKNILYMISRTFSGTKTRGLVGEVLLKEVLKNSIRTKLVKTNLKTDNGVVEFAWDLGDGKFIPIDSKVPDVVELLKTYLSSEDEKERSSVKKQILEKSKKEIDRVRKYQNLFNTIDSCILVFPEAVLDIAPELVGIGAQSNVFVCSYKDVFPIAQNLQYQYVKLKEEGDIGKYKLMIKNLFQILQKISKKAEVIDRALVTLRNANEAIKNEVGKGKREISI